MLIGSAAEQGREAEAATRPAQRSTAARGGGGGATQQAAAAPAHRTTGATRVRKVGARPRGASAARPALPRPAPEEAPLPEVGAGLLAALDAAAASVDTARRTGPALLFAIAWRESRLDPAARSPASSARGLMQFTRGTWLEVVRDHGPRHGLASFAQALSTNPATGEITAPGEPSLLAEILELRDDPRLSAILALERMEAEHDGLRRALRRAPSAPDLYLVHLLGPAGARRFLQALAERPSRPAADAVGAEAVEANRSVFYARNGSPFSLRAVHAEVARVLQAQQRVHAAVVARLAAPPAGRVEVAAAR
jgi:hypothetical protein